jgi:hypothetical protein
MQDFPGRVIMLDRRRRPRSGLPFGLLVIGLVVLVVVSVAQSGLSTIKGYLNGDDRAEVIGSAPDQLLVWSSERSKFDRCRTDEIIRTKRCDRTKVVIISAARMPFIARNISLAWSEGRPAVLTRNTPGKKEQRKKRNLACGTHFERKYPKGSCDEYPFASAVEGGAGARTEEVPEREQDCQGPTLGNSYRYQPIDVGERFVVVISHPDLVPQHSFQGVDIAEEKGTCGI